MEIASVEGGGGCAVDAKAQPVMNTAVSRK